MAESSDLPSAVRDSDAVEDGVIDGPASGPDSSLGTALNVVESRKVETLKQKLELQNKDIAKLTDALESLQKAYIERIENVESEVRRTKDELERNKAESMKNTDE